MAKRRQRHVGTNFLRSEAKNEEGLVFRTIRRKVEEGRMGGGSTMLFHWTRRILRPHDSHDEMATEEEQSPSVTYRYSRRKLSTHTTDSYNAFAHHPHEPRQHSRHPSLGATQLQPSHEDEYWTNGKITHLVVTADEMGRSLPPTTNKFLSTSGTTTSTTSPTTLLHRRWTEPAEESAPPLQAATPKNPASSVARNSLIAGSVSGMASTLMLYPLDVLRTKLQASSAGGPLTVLRQTLRHGGVRSLYTGMTLPLAAQAVYKGTVFTVHNVCQQVLLDTKVLERQKLGQSAQDVRLTLFDTALCGFMAGAVNAGLFVTPVELVRNQLISQDTKRAGGQRGLAYASSSWEVVRYAVQHHGLTGLWRGVGISTLRDGIGVAAFFSAKRTVERALATNQRFNAADEETKASSSFATTVLAGGMAGLSYWVASLPLDTIKTWIQSSDLGQPPPAVGASLRDAYYAADGNLTRVAQRLIRGWQVAYGRGIPSAAITITVYSAAYDALQEG